MMPGVSSIDALASLAREDLHSELGGTGSAAQMAEPDQ